MLHGDLSQIPLKEKIIKHLEYQNRDPEFIKKFKDGYCQGITALALYALWLQTQPVRRMGGKPVPRDDWDWFMSVRKKFDSWNATSLPSKKTIEEFDRFISLIEYFQNTLDYQPIAQGDLEKSMSDTRGRRANREYSLAGMFAAKDFTKSLSVDMTGHQYITTLFNELVKQNRLVIVTGELHDMGLLRLENKYILFNTNNPNLIFEYELDEVDKLVSTIFSENEYEDAKPSPLAFRVFSLDESKMDYPNQKDLLHAVEPQVMSPDAKYAGNCTSLHMAAWIGCSESLDYFLNLNPDVNAKCTDDGSTPLAFAAYNGHIKIVEKLLAKGADSYTRDHEHLDARDIADKGKHSEIVRTIDLARNANLGSRIEKGKEELQTQSTDTTRSLPSNQKHEIESSQPASRSQTKEKKEIRKQPQQAASRSFQQTMNLFSQYFYGKTPPNPLGKSQIPWFKQGEIIKKTEKRKYDEDNLAPTGVKKIHKNE